MKKIINTLIMIALLVPMIASAQCGSTPIATSGTLTCNMSKEFKLSLIGAPCITKAVFAWAECSSADGPDADSIMNDALCTKTMMPPSINVMGTGANQVTIRWQMSSPTWILWQKAPNNYADSVSVYVNGILAKRVNLDTIWGGFTEITLKNLTNAVITFGFTPSDIIANGGNMSVIEWARFGIFGECGSVIDTIPPTITKLPKDTTIYCGQPFPGGNITATDNCDPQPNIKIDTCKLSGHCPVSTAWVYKVTVTDSSGNSTMGQWYVNVVDTTKPIVLAPLPKDITINCTDTIPALLDLLVDDCSPTTQTKSIASTGTPCATILLYTWIISDNCNETVYTRKVTIKDTTAPVWTSSLPKDTTVLIPPPFDTLYAKDDCSTISYTLQETKQGGLCGSVLKRTWTATDACGNTIKHTQTITVTGGGTPWWMSALPKDTTYDCGTVPPMPDLMAKDSFGLVTVSKSEVKVGNDPCSYGYVRTWKAFNACDTITYTQGIMIVDTTAPIWTTPLPADTTIMCGTLSDTATVGAMDMCWGQVGITIVFTQVSTDSTITRTWTATDKCGNSVSHTQRITMLKAQFNLNPIVTNVSCFGNHDGRIDLQPTGSYAYLWNKGDTTAVIDSLYPGTYTVTVSQGACNATFSFTITQPDSMGIQSETTDARCSGEKGRVTLSVTGGTPAYTYLWNTGAMTNSISDSAGTYRVTVTDAHGCTAHVDSLVITQPTLLQLVTSPTAVTCQVGNDGKIDLQVSGGTQPYRFQWSNGSTNPTAANLVPGIYQVVVSDAHGCVLTDTTEVRCLGCKLYPNPVTKGSVATLNINTGDATDTGELTFSIYDIVGKKKRSWTSTISQGYLIETFTADLDAGEYLLECKGASIHFVKRFSIN